MIRATTAVLLTTLAACAPQRPLTQAEAQARYKHSVDLRQCQQEVAASYPPANYTLDCRTSGAQTTCQRQEVTDYYRLTTEGGRVNECMYARGYVRR